MTLQGAAIMLVLKLLVTAACLRAGAEGGLLTPGLTVGGLLSMVLALGLRRAGIEMDAGPAPVPAPPPFWAFPCRCL
jgi:H+/Cl- antiporter ClcA